jgi:UDP-N-acetylmuramoylalanine--D-glutamate ligase
MKFGLLRAPFNRPFWKDRRVLILGLGQYPRGSGMSAAVTFARLGASVTVTDLKKAGDLGSNVRRLKKFKNVRFVLGKHDLKDIDRAELIVANPRVRPDAKEMKRARKRGIPVTSDVALFLDRCPARVIAVTGTRGKSTTSALIAAMLKASGKRVWLGGNILVSPLTFLSKVKSKDTVVLELSSWQCESLSASSRAPDVSVITNLMRDHLNTYEGMEDYAEAKAQIFRHQSPDHAVILNADDPYGRRWIKEAPDIVLTFGKARTNDASLRSGTLFLGKTKIIALRAMKLLGAHNAVNALAAALAAKQAGANLAGIRKTLKTFKPLANRLEQVRIVKGVTYVNDTCATTPDGAIAALHALKDRYGHLWFIMGGADKELDYAELGDAFRRHRNRIGVLLLPGSASDKLRKTLVKRRISMERVPDMKTAVRRASALALKGDAVILSPAAASFGQFQNEFERGERFKAEVRI